MNVKTPLLVVSTSGAETEDALLSKTELFLRNKEGQGLGKLNLSCWENLVTGEVIGAKTGP